MSKRKCAGMSLIELLLAMTLSLLILTLLSGIYLAMEEQRVRQSDLVFVHDNSRAALQILRSEIQAAGYAGCPRLSADFPFSNATPFPVYAMNKLIVGQAKMSLWHREYKADSVLAAMRNSSAIEVSTEVKIKKGDLVLISDCRHADLFQVAQVREEEGRQSIQAINPLRYRYGEAAEVGLFSMNTYFVEETGRFDGQGQAISALYVSSLSRQKEELVEGVQQMEIQSVVNERGVEAVSVKLAAQRGRFRKWGFAFVVLRQG